MSMASRRYSVPDVHLPELPSTSLQYGCLPFFPLLSFFFPSFSFPLPFLRDAYRGCREMMTNAYAAAGFGLGVNVNYKDDSPQVLPFFSFSSSCTPYQPSKVLSPLHHNSHRLLILIDHINLHLGISKIKVTGDAPFS
jgi:hypothetical protein